MIIMKYLPVFFKFSIKKIYCHQYHNGEKKIWKKMFIKQSWYLNYYFLSCMQVTNIFVHLALKFFCHSVSRFFQSSRLASCNAYFKCLLWSISKNMAKKSDCKPEIIKKAANRALVVATVPTNKRYKKRYNPKILPAGKSVKPMQ